MLTYAAVCAAQNVPGTQPLVQEGDLAAQMVAGIGRYLDRELSASVTARAGRWQPDFSSPQAYVKSLQPNRDRLREIIGATDPRVPNPEMQYVSSVDVPAEVGSTADFTVHTVRWPVFEGVFGEGLLLQPRSRVVARVVALPDADQLPEVLCGLAPGLSPALQYARRLAENGCQVIVPTLADRDKTFSGSPEANRFTAQPHREWLYRQAYQLGRHVIGYEVQKVLAAVDWLAARPTDAPAPIGIVGWGEGGLVALYSAALDTRIAAATVSGYFGPREAVWREPIYRNVFGLLAEFGDAEMARLIAPRKLHVEYATVPPVKPALPAETGQSLFTPGIIETPQFADVQREVNRAKQLTGVYGKTISLHHAPAGAAIGPLASDTLLAFLSSLTGNTTPLRAVGPALKDVRRQPSYEERQGRLVRELTVFTQRRMQLAEGVRDDLLWKKVKPTSPEAWREAMRPYRENFWNEVIGRVPSRVVPPNPRSRLLKETPAWTGYEVMLDVLPDVYAWGYLLLPKGMKPGEKRPVVVVQHGLNGTPHETIDEDPEGRGYRFYKAFGAKLAERGFVVYSPQNPYRGDDHFRVLQRKANPLGKSLYSFIVAQHDTILEWLAEQSYVDPQRIGFYGLSYGGKTAMRVPAILERYALSICSGDFNEWTWKNASIDFARSYMFTREYEMYDFNLGRTFGYAEMAALIAPRPFMVERGHDDGVGIDEWVAYEYAKVNRLYAKLRIPEATRIEYFDGPHTIHGVGTFDFLHEKLRWPKPSK